MIDLAPSTRMTLSMRMTGRKLSWAMTGRILFSLMTVTPRLRKGLNFQTLPLLKGQICKENWTNSWAWSHRSPRMSQMMVPTTSRISRRAEARLLSKSITKTRKPVTKNLLKTWMRPLNYWKAPMMKNAKSRSSMATTLSQTKTDGLWQSASTTFMTIWFLA